jgi:hypothetical protein
VSGEHQPRPTEVWCGKGDASAQRIRIVAVQGDRIAFERTAGAPAHALHRDQRCTLEQLHAAFEYAGETEDPFS